MVSDEGSNQFELYATNAGEDQPVVVQFKPGELPPVDINSGLPVLISPNVNAAVVAQFAAADLTSLSEGTVATIATLSTVTVDEGGPQAAQADRAGEAGPNGDLALGGLLEGDSGLGASQGVLVVSGPGVPAAAAIPGDGDEAFEGGNAPAQNPDEPRVTVERFITGIEERLALAIQEAEGSRGTGVTEEQLRRAIDQLFTRVGSFGLAQEGADALNQSGAAVQGSLSAANVSWLKRDATGQSDGVRLSDVLATVEASVNGVDRVFLSVRDQLLAPTPEGPAQRTAPVDAPLSQPLNPLDGDSRAPADDRNSAFWMAAALAAGLGGDVTRRRSRRESIRGTERR